MRIDPKVDYAFKCLFGSEDTKDLLISLLKAILNLDIRDVEILNPFNSKDEPDGKISILDVKARLGDGTLVNIEMQIQLRKDYRSRSLYYWSKVFSDQLKQGEKYGQLCRTVGIHIVDDVLFPGVADYHLEFGIRALKHPGVSFTDQLALHTIELPKLRIKADAARSPLEEWCCLIRDAHEWDPDAPPARMLEGAYGRAIERLKAMFQNEHERELYENRMKALRDLNSIRSEGEEIGFEKGLRASIQAGLENRFGTAGNRLMDRINAVSEKDKIDQLMKAAWTVPTIEEFERLLG